ncbi:MAG: efflux RND transporter permease subunit [Lentimicrobiaceae bacterium]|nr:efflux RND transporter permease subunit [Lentimicrobiaceae bacterium]
MSLYRTSVNKPVTVALIFVTVAILGVFSLTKLSTNLFPDMGENTILVVTSYSGASAADIETNVSKPLENALNSVSNLKHLSSTSKENISVIALEFEYGIDINEATNDVRDKLDMVTQALPDAVSIPTIFKFSMEDMPIMLLSATAEESLSSLDKILDDKVATPLARVNGVGTISVSGAPKREIQVFVDPDKLAAYGITVESISSTLAYENRNTPAGTIDIGSNTYSVRVEKEFKSAEEMLDVVVGTSPNGAPVYLRDVAKVNDGEQERLQKVYSNGRQGAMITIQKQTDANTVQVVKGIKKELKKIQKDLPSDININIIIDGSTNIIDTINSLKDTILTTFLLVMAVVFLFLGRWRATIIIVLSIPISLVASVIYLFATGNTLNIISMSALTIAIGMVVDDAIVVLENITSHIDKGAKPKEAAVHATQEVSISVIASTLTMLAVFLPLTMVDGIIGIFFKQLGWIVSIIMIVSTSAALTLVPMMCSRMLKQNPRTHRWHTVLFTPINKGLDALSRGYGRLINWAVTHRKSVVFIALLIFVVTCVTTLPNMKSGFLPAMDQGRLSISIELPVGTGEEITGQLANELSTKYRSEIPEIKMLNYNYGMADEDNAFASMQNNGTHIISMNIDLGRKTERERSTQEIAEYIRKDLKNNTIIKKYNVSEGGGMGGATTVKLEIYGYDFQNSDRIAFGLRDSLLNTPQFSQVLVSRDDYTPEYYVDFDREKLRLNGIDVTTASTMVRNRINGSVMTFFREDGDEYNIRVRYAPEFRQSIEDIENIILYGSQGQSIRVKDVAQVVEGMTPPKIERKDRERVVTVTGVVAKGYALSEAVEVAQKHIENAEIPTEFMVKIAGDYENQQDSFSGLFTLLILIIILVYVVMASQFESLLDPFVIMFSVPFAIVGVLIGLAVNNMALDVMAMIGILILVGIVVKNGIVLIDYAILCRERGMDVNTAVTTASQQRLRPILMTTLTTVLGMIPMALGSGEGAEMWNGLGITVSWGLTVSTLITLVLIPTLYAIFISRREKRQAKKQLRIKN